MCDTYLYIEISMFLYLDVLIHWNGQFIKPGFSHFVLKLNYNKVVCITLIDFYYLISHLFTFYKHFIYYFKYRDTVLYCDIFGSSTQYYYLVAIIMTTYMNIRPSFRKYFRGGAKVEFEALWG